MRKTLLILTCLFAFSTNVFAAQVVKKTGYFTESTNKNKYTTFYYLVNDRGARVSTENYDYLQKITSNLFIAKDGNNFGAIDANNVIKIPFTYDNIKPMKYNVLRFSENGKYGLMDYSGRTFLNAKYSYLEKIDDRVLKYSQDQTTGDSSGRNIGLINYSGGIIASPKYLYIDKINNYMLRVVANASASASTTPETPLPSPPDAATPAPAPAPTTQPQDANGKKYGIIDYQGRTIISPQFDYLTKVSNTILKVKKGKSWGRIEFYNGNIINIMYDYQSYW